MNLDVEELRSFEKFCIQSYKNITDTLLYHPTMFKFYFTWSIREINSTSRF